MTPIFSRLNIFFSLKYQVGCVPDTNTAHTQKKFVHCPSHKLYICNDDLVNNKIIKSNSVISSFLPATLYTYHCVSAVSQLISVTVFVCVCFFSFVYCMTMWTAIKHTSQFKRNTEHYIQKWNLTKTHKSKWVPDFFSFAALNVQSL